MEESYAGILGLILIILFFWYLHKRGSCSQQEVLDDTNQIVDDVESGVQRVGRKRRKSFFRSKSRSRSRGPKEAKTVQLEEVVVMDTYGNQLQGLRGRAEFVDRWEHHRTRAEAEARATELGGKCLNTRDQY